MPAPTLARRAARRQNPAGVGRTGHGRCPAIQPLYPAAGRARSSRRRPSRVEFISADGRAARPQSRRSCGRLFGRWWRRIFAAVRLRNSVAQPAFDIRHARRNDPRGDAVFATGRRQPASHGMRGLQEKRGSKSGLHGPAATAISAIHSGGWVGNAMRKFRRHARRGVLFVATGCRADVAAAQATGLPMSDYTPNSPTSTTLPRLSARSISSLRFARPWRI